MKRVLQHSKTGLYLGFDGRLTEDAARAWVCPTLSDAVVFCSKSQQTPADFVYRMIELTPSWFRPELFRQFVNAVGARA